MRIFIRNRKMDLAESGRDRIERSLRFALGRFAPRIRRVAVGLVDLNGPRGGVDKRCRVKVTLEPSGSVFVEEDGSDLLAVIDRAAERVGRSVERKLERHRELGGRALRTRSGLAARPAGTPFAAEENRGVASPRGRGT